jgi:hypothetical protein
MKHCNKCNTTKSFEAFRIDNKGKCKSYCKTCEAAYTKAWRKANPEKVLAQDHTWAKRNKERMQRLSDGYHRSPERKYKILETRHKKWEGDFISFEFYKKLIVLPCSYCGGELPPKGTGIDRINSKKGYTANNCAPCCTRCNQLFSNYNKEETLDHIQKIIKYIKP